MKESYSSMCLSYRLNLLDRISRMILSDYFIILKLESSVLNNRNQVWNHEGSTIIIGYKPHIKRNGLEIFTSECLFLWACLTRVSSLWGIWRIEGKKQKWVVSICIFEDRFIIFLSTIGGSTKTKKQQRRCKQHSITEKKCNASF